MHKEIFKSNKRDSLVLLLVISVSVLIPFVGCDGNYLYDVANSSNPDIPIKVECRNSLIGAGMVIIVKNQSDKDLVLDLSCENSATNQKMAFTIHLSANQTRELGWRELNWQFEPGEMVSFRCPGYKTVRKRMPTK